MTMSTFSAAEVDPEVASPRNGDYALSSMMSCSRMLFFRRGSLAESGSRSAGPGFLLVALILIGCGKGASAGAQKGRPAPSVVVAKVVARDVPVEVQAPVDLRPLEQVDVGSKVLGYVDAIFVERGDRVKKGQIVALVRPSDLPDQLTAARSSIGQIKAQAALARTNFERASKLAPSGVVSQQELQAATAALASVEAAESSAQAQISGLAIRLGETRITSPITGYVSARRLDPGALVGPPGGGAIVTVVRMDRLRVFLTLNENDAMGVSVGMDAHVELDALPGRSYSGKVVRVAPSFDPLTRSLDAEVQLANDKGELRPGMYGRGSIRRETHPNTPVVQVTAVQISSGKKYAFVLRENKVERRQIVTGAEVDDGSLLEIRSGLSAGEEVVIAGADALADGAQVRVARDVNPYTGAPTAAPGSQPRAEADSPRAPKRN
jgi:RND family efflux transporter MFP subunit